MLTVDFDLLGLPPTYEQIEAFAANRSPLAYEQLVDELLASPRYGERWGRYWLDVVRFAETCGYERDQIKPNIWRYRDTTDSGIERTASDTMGMLATIMNDIQRRSHD